MVISVQIQCPRRGFKKEMQSMDMEALLNDFVTRGMLESHSKLTQQRSDGRLALQ